MTDPSLPNPNDPEPGHDASAPGPAGEPAKASGATAILDSLRDAIDDIAVRATPAVREVSARAAELTAQAASKAAPLAKKAGDATAEASDKLAERSKTWAAGVRAAMGSEPAADAAGDVHGAATAVADAATDAASDAADTAKDIAADAADAGRSAINGNGTPGA